MSGELLTDKHVHAAQVLLQEQFPKQNGLQCTLVLAEKNIWNSQVCVPISTYMKAFMLG